MTLLQQYHTHFKINKTLRCSQFYRAAVYNLLNINN